MAWRLSAGTRSSAAGNGASATEIGTIAHVDILCKARAAITARGGVNGARRPCCDRHALRLPWRPGQKCEKNAYTLARCHHTRARAPNRFARARSVGTICGAARPRFLWGMTPWGVWYVGGEAALGRVIFPDDCFFVFFFTPVRGSGKIIKNEK